MTLEDPVEMQVPGITQVNVNERTGMTFSRGLRSVLRQDPDVVLVGEVRDPEAEYVKDLKLPGGRFTVNLPHIENQQTFLAEIRKTDATINAAGRLSPASTGCGGATPLRGRRARRLQSSTRASTGRGSQTSARA